MPSTGFPCRSNRNSKEGTSGAPLQAASLSFAGSVVKDGSASERSLTIMQLPCSLQPLLPSNASRRDGQELHGVRRKAQGDIDVTALDLLAARS